MARSIVGLLAAAGVTMAALVVFAHGGFIVVAIAGAALATGLAGYYTAPSYQ